MVTSNEGYKLRQNSNKYLDFLKFEHFNLV